MKKNRCKYEIIQEKLRKRIEKGDYSDQIPHGDDLAAEFGANINTVSKAINSLVKEGLLRRVSGRGTFIEHDDGRQRKSEVKKIALMLATGAVDLPAPKELWNSETINAITHEAERNGYQVVLKNNSGDLDQEKEIIKNVSQDDCQGLIAVPITPPKGNGNAKVFAKFAKPLVFIDHPLAGVNADLVQVDNYTAGFQATEHLIQLGHKRIMHISRRTPVSSVLERLRGYKDALSSAGLKFDPSLVFESEIYLPGGMAELEKFLYECLRSKSPASAVFSCNDGIAAAVYKFCMKFGVKIPEKLAVIGFDDGYLAQTLEISTMAQPFAEIGRFAFELLLDKINNPNEKVTHRILPTFLRTRHSTSSQSDLGAMKSFGEEFSIN